MNDNILFSYLKRHRLGILLFTLISMIFAIILYLYHLPVEAVMYAIELSSVLCILIIAVDFIQYRRKHLYLSQLKNSITVNRKALPEPNELIEKDYKELLDILYEENSKLSLQADVNRRDLIDYYTLWAHQIKTPIAALRLLLQTTQDIKDEELLSELTTELFKIEQYVEMVLTYLRMEGMSSDLLLKKYSLDDIVKQAVRKNSTLFIHNRIHLNLSELNCEVLTDEKWLVFVIEQVLTNSLKYTREDGSISIYMDAAKPKTLVIADTGIGIEASDLPRVFEKGFTGYNGRADKKSTGIGLYLCKQIITKLSHTIEIASEVGKGTTVRIGLETLDMKVE